MNNQPRDHIVPVPAFFQALRIAQLILAAVVLALSAYGLSALTWVGGADYSIFVAIATFIIVGYYLASTIRLTQLYNRIAILVLECFVTVWWLSNWAYLASWAAAFTAVDVDLANCDEFGNCFEDRAWRNQRNALAAAAGVGALNFVLFIITLVVFSIGFHRQRIAGAPWSAAGTWANGAANGSGQGGPANSGVPMVAQPVAGQMEYPKQPVFTQQPVHPGHGAPEFTA